MKNSLSTRLSAVADLIKDNKITADIGTDHAALPIYLIKSGRAKRVYASDIHQGPLRIAQKNIDEAGLTDKISVIHSDGLKEIPKDAREIVIAGMGGKVISKIIEEAAFMKLENVGFVLQPMSDSTTLRRFLYQNGFEILKEFAFEDAGHIYSVMRVEYKNNPVIPDEVMCRIGGIDPKAGGWNRVYIQREIFRLTKKIEGIKKSSSLESTGKDEKIREQLESILEED